MPAEDVGVVLLETPHSSQPRQGPAVLISVQDAKVGQPEGKLPPRPRPVAEHQAVTCTGSPTFAHPPGPHHIITIHARKLKIAQSKCWPPPPRDSNEVVYQPMI
jgi:hypothetical protein